MSDINTTFSDILCLQLPVQKVDEHIERTIIFQEKKKPNGNVISLSNTILQEVCYSAYVSFKDSILKALPYSLSVYSTHSL